MELIVRNFAGILAGRGCCFAATQARLRGRTARDALAAAQPKCIRETGPTGLRPALRITYESAAAHASRTSSGKGLSAPYGRRDSGVGGPETHARPSAAFECSAEQRAATKESGRIEDLTEPPKSAAKPTA